jgi:hypothetical protein
MDFYKSLLVLGSLLWVGIPCFIVAIFGSKMINDMGNFPTKTAEIQMRGVWIIIVQVVFFLITFVIYRILV